MLYLKKEGRERQRLAETWATLTQEKQNNEMMTQCDNLEVGS